jgi:hypothetical protein
MLGHTQPATTARYAHLLDDPRRKAADTVGAIISAAETSAPGATVVARGEGRTRPSADSDEVARAFRDDLARGSDMMSPGVRCLAGGCFFAFGGVAVNPWMLCWRVSVAGCGR